MFINNNTKKDTHNDITKYTPDNTPDNTPNDTPNDTIIMTLKEHQLLHSNLKQHNYLDIHILKQPNKQTIYNKQNKHNTTKTEKKCWCYNKDSLDMRCCGLCYTFCYIPDKDKQCYLCPETFEIYYNSGYVITTDGGSQTGEECEHCVCTTFCLPVKLILFWPCLFGSLFNTTVNFCRNTNENYLC